MSNYLSFPIENKMLIPQYALLLYQAVILGCKYSAVLEQMATTESTCHIDGL